MAGLTVSKAKKILREGIARGRRLSAKQKKFFGAVAGGQSPRKSPRKSSRKSSRKRLRRR